MIPQLPSLKLTYFDIKGRAEPIRLCLAIGSVPFEDTRIGHEEWAGLKSKVPGGQLPVMQINDGAYIAESVAMLRYAGKLSGLYPEEPLKALLVDQYVDVTNTIMGKLVDLYIEKDQEKKIALRKNLVSITIPQYFERMSSYIRDNTALGHTGGYLAGSTITIADLLLYVMLGWISSGLLGEEAVDIAKTYPAIHALADTIANIPSVASFEAKHQK